MFYFSILILFLICLGVMIFADFEGLQVLCGIFAFCVGVVLLPLTIMIPHNHLTADGAAAQWREERKTLVYLAESDIEETGRMSADTTKDIQDYNERLVWRQELQRNFWMGVFFPNIYDEFETIDIDSYRTK